MEKLIDNITNAFDIIFDPFRKILGNFYYPFFIIVTFVLFQALFSIGTLNLYVLQIVVFVLINIVMTVSLGMVNGFTGQFSIGHAAFMALGAYSSIIITTVLGTVIGSEGIGYIFNTNALLNSGNAGLVLLSYVMFFISLLIGGVIAGIGGYLIGMPTLRLKGDYLAIVTMAFCEIIRTIIRVTPVLGGPRGIGGIPKFINVYTFFIVFFFCIISVYFMRNYLFSSFGRACKAIRDNDIAAESMGVNTTRQKIHVFVISSFIAGICGGIYAHQLAYIHPDNFTFIKSLDYLIYLYIGGSASISGAALGATVFTIIPEAFRFLDDWRMVIYPLVLIIVMLARTEGLMITEFRVILTKKLRRSRKTAS